MAQPNAVQDTRFDVQGRMRRERCELQDFKAVSPTGLLLCKRKRVRGEFTCRQTSSKFSCSHKIGGHSLDEKFRADASLMRISRQIERDEMCYRNDEGVIPF